ncbi:MAG: hypothetical protein V4689_04635 [Verrucomicrobiota bacterium]
MDEDEKKSSHAGGWLMAVVVLLVVYVLSIGPAARWTIAHPGPNVVLWKFYAPVTWAMRHTPLGKPLGDYVRWWTP